jgi:hypothetical protein
MMNTKMRIRKGRLLWLAAAFLLVSGSRPLRATIGVSGDLKWLRVGAMQTYISEQGAETECDGTSTVSIEMAWPADYGLIQYTERSNGMWLGSKDFYDPVTRETVPYKVVCVGPRHNDDQKYAIVTPPAEFKLIGRTDHPIVIVDNKLASIINTQYDILDGLDDKLPADRMLVVKNHTSMGVTITKRVYAFGGTNHDNYLVYDYTLKNTGIVDRQGTVYSQTVKDLMLCLHHRWALSGESVLEYNQGWGIWESCWGRSTVNDVVGTDPTDPNFLFRADIAWYGRQSERTCPDDWGCPDDRETGVLAAAKYVGSAVLHADKSPSDRSDDLYQPKTTYYLDSDDNTNYNYNQYDKIGMAAKYAVMIKGHAAKTQAQQVGDAFADTWGPGIGGTQSVQGFGPYTLKAGDSVHVVVAKAISGLSRQKNREVGTNWFNAWKGLPTPPLVRPNGQVTTDYNLYKREWVFTCKDSLMQTLKAAVENYKAGYRNDEPPPAPKSFTVMSGGDRIQLTWADNAVSWPKFNGYVIYRSEGNVAEPKTVYAKIFECDKANAAHSYADVTAVRGFDYYYYIQSKDDGTANTVHKGVPLYSSKFLTLTNEKARLLRPAGTALEKVRVVPNPWDIRARSLQFGAYSQYDRIAFYGLPPKCHLKIFTENGVLIWEKDHTNGAGDELWDSMTMSGQIIVSGVYMLYVEVLEDTHDTWSKKDDALLYKKGDSVIRKFVVIR